MFREGERLSDGPCLLKWKQGVKMTGAMYNLETDAVELGSESGPNGKTSEHVRFSSHAINAARATIGAVSTGAAPSRKAFTVVRARKSISESVGMSPS
ncbi:hypothetical protein V1292_006045 [Bradyrhizobium sp. AZCC 1719]